MMPPHHGRAGWRRTRGGSGDPRAPTWGDFGRDDELGRLNLVTPRKVLQGIAEVRHGLTFCLSLPLDYPGGSVLNPRRAPPELRPTMRNGRPNMTYPLRCDDPTATDVICDDQVLLTLQYSTQWDSLAHVGQMFDVDGDGVPEDVFYNGFRAGEDIVARCATIGREMPARSMTRRVRGTWAWRTWRKVAFRAAA